MTNSNRAAEIERAREWLTDNPRHLRCEVEGQFDGAAIVIKLKRISIADVLADYFLSRSQAGMDEIER